MSERAEEAVIGSILQRPGLIATAELTADDFTGARRQIWTVLNALARHAKPIDIFSVAGLMGGGEEDERQLARYCLQVMDCGSPSNFDAYVEMVRDSTRKAQAKTIAQRLLERIETDEGLDPVNDAIRDLMLLNANRQRYEWTAKEATIRAAELTADARARGSVIEIPTGLKDLDEALGGWHRKDLVVIGARPAVGKTAFMLNLADRCGVPCGIISAEQPYEQIGLRFLAMAGRVPLQVLRAATLNDAEQARVDRSLSVAGSKPIWINDCPAAPLDTVIQQARKWRYEHGIQVLFLDYVQRIRYTSDSKRPRHEQVMEIAMALKTLAAELDIPIVALAQINREVEKRDDKRPMMGDLKDSGSLEQEADQVLTLYRDEVYHPDTPDKAVVEINVCKNRHGTTGCIRVAWMGDFLRFENLAAGGDRS